MIFSRRRRRRRFGTVLVVGVGGVVKSPGHETWKMCSFRTSGTKKGKKYSDTSELCTFLPEFCICTCCILAFLEISWLEAEAKHHRLFRWGKSAEIQQKLRKKLTIFVYCTFLVVDFIGDSQRESHSRNPLPILRSFLEAEVEQEVDSEAQIWNSGTLGDTWAMFF